MATPRWISLVLKTIGDFFLDKNGDGDEKRFWGNAFLLSALLIIFIWGPGESTWITAGGMATFGAGLLIKASSADSKTPPPPANPTQGITG